jgi:hypothetical protein
LIVSRAIRAFFTDNWRTGYAKADGPAEEKKTEKLPDVVAEQVERYNSHHTGQQFDRDIEAKIHRGNIDRNDKGDKSADGRCASEK